MIEKYVMEQYKIRYNKDSIDYLLDQTGNVTYLVPCQGNSNNSCMCGPVCMNLVELNEPYCNDCRTN